MSSINVFVSIHLHYVPSSLEVWKLDGREYQHGYVILKDEYYDIQYRSHYDEFSLRHGLIIQMDLYRRIKMYCFQIENKLRYKKNVFFFKLEVAQGLIFCVSVVCK